MHFGNYLILSAISLLAIAIFSVQSLPTKETENNLDDSAKNIAMVPASDQNDTNTASSQKRIKRCGGGCGGCGHGHHHDYYGHHGHGYDHGYGSWGHGGWNNLKKRSVDIEVNAAKRCALGYSYRRQCGYSYSYGGWKRAASSSESRANVAKRCSCGQSGAKRSAERGQGPRDKIRNKRCMGMGMMGMGWGGMGMGMGMGGCGCMGCGGGCCGGCGGCCGGCGCCGSCGCCSCCHCSCCSSCCCGRRLRAKRNVL